MATNTTTVYTVISGTHDGADLILHGTFRTYEAALAHRNELYKETNYLQDDDEDMGPDLNSKYVDDGQMFWSIAPNELY